MKASLAAKGFCHYQGLRLRETTIAPEALIYTYNFPHTFLPQVLPIALAQVAPFISVEEDDNREETHFHADDMLLSFLGTRPGGEIRQPLNLVCNHST